MPESSSMDSPPEYQQNDIQLVAQASSRITAVGLYPGRAEVTRVFKLSLKQGTNRVKISGLPTFLERSSLRVEGRGLAVIHDVTVASATREPVLHTSEVLSNLYLKTKRAEQEVARCEAAASSLEKFFHALTPGQVEVTKLHTYMETYEDEARKIDERLLLVRQELDGLRVQIAIEESRLRSLSCSVPELSINVSVVVFADDEGEAEISLIYGVAEANWSAQYDLRINLESKEKAVKLIYKASICQNTGENWDNISLTLETVTPTFGVGLPTLSSCRLSVRPPMTAGPTIVNVPPSSRSSRSRRSRSRSYSRSPERQPMVINVPPHSMPAMPYAKVGISNFGSLSTSYAVPGLISVPNDLENHSFTIVELELDAFFSWIVVPRVDTRVHLKAQLKNDSQYMLAPGEGNVYVDGSFVSRTRLPAVSPQESFDCPLGLDPAIRVTYHPFTQKISASGFYKKMNTKTFSQRISLINTKPTAIDNIKIVDRIPVSEDSQITVNLINPTLPLAPSVKRGSRVFSRPLKIAEGITAQWEGLDDSSELGKDGRLNWECAIPPGGRIELSMQWEESWPADIHVVSHEST